MRSTPKPFLKPPKKTTEGIALIATILILAMCFSSLLTVLSLTSLSVKRGGKTQYHSYQALLAAESGVNSFVARSAPNLFDSSKSDVSLDALNSWLERNNLDELNLLSGSTNIENTLRFTSSSPQSVTLESIGTIYKESDTSEKTTVAKKVLRVDFKLHAAGSSLGIQTNAALTTLGVLNLEGSASLTGANAQDWSGLIRDYDEARAKPTGIANSKKFQLRTQHPNRFHSGQYIELSSGRFKVTTVDKNASTLELAGLAPTSSEIISDTEIALIPFALATDLASTNAKTIELPISSTQANAFAVGQMLSIAGYGAIIDSINENDITISWTGTIPKQDLPEGSSVSLGTLGARSTHGINSTATNSFDGGKEENANLQTNALFEKSFGLSKDELLGPLNSYNQRSGKSFEFHTGTELLGVASLNGLYYTEDNLYFSTSNPLCGSALVIVAANVSVSAVCEAGFSGLLYVFGTYSQTSGHIDGAVVSEEARAFPTPSATSQTQLSGTASISYNATALNGWQSYLQDELALQDGKQNFQQVAGSWRLE